VLSFGGSIVWRLGHFGCGYESIKSRMGSEGLVILSFPRQLRLYLLIPVSSSSFARYRLSSVGVGGLCGVSWLRAFGTMHANL